jgi:thymidylate kinase
MKHIIIEGGDRLGKSSLIRGICEHFDFNNVCVRHFGKPPKGMTPNETLEFQFESFHKESYLSYHMHEIMDGDVWMYYPTVLLWDRSHLGEYVYSQMFRGIDKKTITNRILGFEKNSYLYPNQIHLVTLTADPEFFLSKEDGESFSKDLVQKTRELELFKEVHDISQIKNKLLIKVDQDGVFKSKEEILTTVLNFIK